MGSTGNVCIGSIDKTLREEGRRVREYRGVI